MRTLAVTERTRWCISVHFGMCWCAFSRFVRFVPFFRSLTPMYQRPFFIPISDLDLFLTLFQLYPNINRDNLKSLTRGGVERGSSSEECRTRNQVSPGSNPPLQPFRRLGIFVLSIDALVDSAV